MNRAFKSLLWSGLVLLAVGLVGCGAQAPIVNMSAVVDSDTAAMSAAYEAFYSAKTPDAMRAAVAAAEAAGPTSAAYHELAAELAVIELRRADALTHLLEGLRDPRGDNALALLDRLTDFDWTFQDRLRINGTMDALRRQHSQPAARAVAAWLRAHSAHVMGQYDIRDQALSEVTTRLKPAILGPFDNDQGKGFDAEFAPEKALLEPAAVQLDTSYQGKLLDLKWRTDYGIDPRGKIDLGGLLHPTKWQVAYALSAVEVAKAGDYELRLSSTGAIKVWLNGQLVYGNRRLSSWSFDGLVLPVRLRAGTNRVVIKTANSTGSWLLVSRVTRPGGESAQGLVRPTRPESAYTSTGPAPCERCPVQLRIPELSLGADALRGAFNRLRWSASLGLNSARVSAAESLEKAHPESIMARYKLALALWDNAERGRTADLLNQLQESYGEPLPTLRMKQARFWRQQKLNRKARGLVVKLTSSHSDRPEPLLMLAKMYDQEGWHAERCRILAAANARWPKWPSVMFQYADCLEELRFYPRAMAIYHEAMQYLPNSPTVLRNLHWLYQSNDRFEDAIEYAQALTDGWPHMLSSWRRLGETYRRMGKNERAARAWGQLLSRSPQSPDGPKLLARLAIEADDPVNAVRLWKLGLERNPNDEKVRNRVAWLAPEKEGAWTAEAPNEAQLLAAVATREKLKVHPSANTIYLLDDEVTQLGADGSTTNIVTMVAHAANQAGRDRLTKMSIRHGRHRIMHAFAVGPDGTRVEASSIRGRTVRFRQLSVGSTVVLQYRVASRPDGYLAGHIARNWWFQGVGVQVHKARWVLYAPAGTILNEMVRGPIKRTEQEAKGMKRVVWSAENVEPVITEPGMPGLSEVAAHVSMSTVPNWEMFWKWEEALLVDAFRDSPEIVALAQELVDGAETAQEKIDRIHTYLMKKIRYQQDYERTIAGVKPHAAPMVVARQYGDCKDKAVLFITLARLVGIKVHFALVRTRNTGPVRREVPMQQFNHAIVYVPPQEGINEGRFYDPTVDALDVDVLRHDDQGTLSLVFDPDAKTHQWRKIPFQTPDFDVTKRDLVARILDDGGVEGDMEMTAKGRVGEFLRKAARNPEVLKQLLARRVVVGMISSAKMTGHTPVEVAAVDKPARIQMQIKAPKVVREEGRSLRMKVPITWSPASWFTLAERRHSLLLGTPRTETWRVELEAPEGGHFERAPGSIVLEDKCLYFSRKVETSKRILKVEQTVRVQCERVGVKQYEAYRELSARIVRAIEEEVVIRAPRSWVSAQR